MSNDKQVILVTKELEKKIIERTPKKYIKTRVGRGGMSLSYIETGFVIARLNEIFNYNWDFEVLDEKMGKSHIVVRGKLTAKIYNPKTNTFETIIKTQYGGSELKFGRGSTVPIDPADDLKAAASDSLKKCASMFGIGQDVFWPSGAEYQEPDAPQEPVGKMTYDQQKKIFALISEKGKTKHDLDTYIYNHFTKDSIIKLTVQEANQVIDALILLPVFDAQSPDPISDDEFARDVDDVLREG